MPRCAVALTPSYSCAAGFQWQTGGGTYLIARFFPSPLAAIRQSLAGFSPLTVVVVTVFWVLS
jgi:hypothetical protein